LSCFLRSEPSALILAKSARLCAAKVVGISCVTFFRHRKLQQYLATLGACFRPDELHLVHKHRDINDAAMPLPC